MPETDRHLAENLARHFIARRDVKAMQVADGGYRPVSQPFQMADLVAHIQGKRTFGHYLLDPESKCKFFAFDCDLNEGDCERRTREFFPECCQEGHGNWVQWPDLSEAPVFPTLAEEDTWFHEHTLVHNARPREQWLDRSHPGRPWWKHQMRSLGDLLASRIRRHLGIPALVTYTGGKGVHVYGFTGYMEAEIVREAADNVLASFGRFEAAAGKNFYRDTSDDIHSSFSNFTIEVFPKQTHVEPGHFGNLMRLPFGRNLKNPHDPTFIVDERRPTTQLAPVPDQVLALNSLDPFRGQPVWS